MDNEGILGVDIECTECGKLMALSNAFKYDHKYLCPKCAPDLDEITSSHQIPRGATVRSKTMYEQKLEQELAELKEMVRYRQYIQRMLNEGEIQVGGLGKLDATDKWLEQAVTLAKGDSKEEE